MLLNLKQSHLINTSQEFKNILQFEKDYILFNIVRTINNFTSEIYLKCENNSSAFLASVLIVRLPEAKKSEGKLNIN